MLKQQFGPVPLPLEVLREYAVIKSATSESVTVIISLYNYEKFILEALQSVSEQTHQTLDLIVVDDASTDEGSTLAANWLDVNHKRFRRACIIRHPRNLGLSAARNTAFELAQTKYVFVLDADNCLYPTAIAKLSRALESSAASVAYSQIEFFGRERGFGFASEWDPDLFRVGNYVDAMALVRRSAWARVGGYAPLDLGWEDYDLWLKFIEHGMHGIFLPEILCRYRVHGQSMLRTVTDLHDQRVRAQLTFLHPWLDL